MFLIDRVHFLVQIFMWMTKETTFFDFCSEHKSVLEVLNLCACAEWKCCPCHLSYAFSTYTARVIATFLLRMPVPTEKIPGDRTACKKRLKECISGMTPHQVFLVREDGTAWLHCICVFPPFHFTFSTVFCVSNIFWGHVWPLQKKNHSYGPTFVSLKMDCSIQGYVRMYCFQFLFSRNLISNICSFGILSVLRASIMMHFNDETLTQVWF